MVDGCACVFVFLINCRPANGQIGARLSVLSETVEPFGFLIVLSIQFIQIIQKLVKDSGRTFKISRDSINQPLILPSPSLHIQRPFSNQSTQPCQSQHQRNAKRNTGGNQQPHGHLSHSLICLPKEALHVRRDRAKVGVEAGNRLFATGANGLDVGVHLLIWCNLIAICVIN